MTARVRAAVAKRDFERLGEIAEARDIRFAVLASDAIAEATKFQTEATAAGVAQVVVFSDLVAACSWLDIDLPATRALKVSAMPRFMMTSAGARESMQLRMTAAGYWPAAEAFASAR